MKPCRECGNKHIYVVGSGIKIHIECLKCGKTCGKDLGVYLNVYTLIEEWDRENNMECQKER